MFVDSVGRTNRKEEVGAQVRKSVANEVKYLKYVGSWDDEAEEGTLTFIGQESKKDSLFNE